MNLKVEYDNDYFLVQINGAPLCKGPLRSADEYDVKVGDTIRISTTYKRNWYVNGKAIGLQDREDDAMYQNIYTMVTADYAKGSRLVIRFKEDTGGLVGDYLPHSLADAEILCPNEWRFFKSSATPVKGNFELFKDMCEIWDFGEYIRQIDDTGRRFKRLSKVKDYYGLNNVCGVVKDGEKYLWVSTGVKGDSTDFVEKPYKTLSELTSSVPVEFFGMTPAPNFDF